MILMRVYRMIGLSFLFHPRNVICRGQKIMSGRSEQNEEAKLEEKSGVPSFRWRMNVFKSPQAM